MSRAPWFRWYRDLMRQAPPDLPLRLVFSRARERSKYRPSWLPDLVGAGNLGLVEAMSRYRPERRTKLSTLAYVWIDGAILRWIEQETEHRRPLMTFPGPSGVQVDDPDDDRFENFLRAIGIEDEEPEDRVRSGQHGDPERELQRVERIAELRLTIMRLEWPERHVIDMRYGLDGGDGLTRKRIAERLWRIGGLIVNEDGVREIERRALRRLRKWGHWRYRKPKPRQPQRWTEEQPCEHTINGRHESRWPWPFVSGVQARTLGKHKKHPFSYRLHELERTASSVNRIPLPEIWTARPARRSPYLKLRYPPLIDDLNAQGADPSAVYVAAGHAGDMGGPRRPWRRTRLKKAYESVPQCICGSHNTSMSERGKRPKTGIKGDRVGRKQRPAA